MAQATDVQTIISDAAGYAKKILLDAGNAADKILDTAAANASQDLPKIETDVFNALMDFVPSAYRQMVAAFVAPLVAGVEEKFNGTITADIAKGIAIAKLRINAVTGATG